MSRMIYIGVSIAMFVASAFSQVTIKEASGWLESAFVKWEPMSGADSYNVYYSGGGVTNQKIDAPLIRKFSSFYRADILGLKAGEYTIKIVPVSGGTEKTTSGTTTQSLSVKAQVRAGYAFSGASGRVMPGGYNEDGTLKSDAKVIYASSSTANTVTCDVAGKTITGLTTIITERGKGTDKTPLVVRIIGLIKKDQISGLKDGNFISFTGSNNTDKMISNITIEGVGDDATLHGYGIGLKRSNSIEIRNLAIMLFGDDGISMDTDNGNIWIHNNDFFYGAPGADADQVKGDGTIDMKYNSSNITISFNHFWDSGKSMGCGGSTETVPTFYVTFHHNWFDHVDSRNPRLHYTTAHVFNNYYDGVSKYCIGNTTETSALVEANYFRGSSRPMMISGQGTDKYDSVAKTYTLKGTFSGQTGGMTKAYNNKFDNSSHVVYQAENATQFDAYLVNTQTETVPSSVKSVSGSFAYTNFDTDAKMYKYTADAPEDVKNIVTKYAGRVNGGIFKWTFDNSVEDTNSEIITALKNAIVNYTESNGVVSVLHSTSQNAQQYIGARFNPGTSTIEILHGNNISHVAIYSLRGTLVNTYINTLNKISAEELQPGSYIAALHSGNTVAQTIIFKKQ